jgi:hypothetical protein
MTEEKKFYIDYKDGKMSYFMVDLKSVEVYGVIHIYSKYKPCKLVFDYKKLVALEPDLNRSYAFEYFYKIVPLAEKFRKVKRHEQYVCKDRLVGETITEIKDKHV